MKEKTILDTLADAARARVEENKKKKPMEVLKKEAKSLAADTGFPFEKALAAPGISVICEVKKASPSKGLIAVDFPYLEIARQYERAGASAISVLTEPEYFLGSDDYLQEIAREVSIPVLRKDFTVDEYQIYEAKLLGASAVLLICAILSEKELGQFLKMAHSLGLSALVEAHDEEEVARAIFACNTPVISAVGYPMYDWKTEDIWVANGRFHWDYNHLYDLYYQAGLSLNRQRVASPFISEANSYSDTELIVQPCLIQSY